MFLRRAEPASVLADIHLRACMGGRGGGHGAQVAALGDHRAGSAGTTAITIPTSHPASSRCSARGLRYRVATSTRHRGSPGSNPGQRMTIRRRAADPVRLHLLPRPRRLLPRLHAAAAEGHGLGQHRARRCRSGSVIRQFMSGLGAVVAALRRCHVHLARRVDLPHLRRRPRLWESDFGIPDECDIYNMSLCAKVEHASGAIPTAEYLLDLLAANGYVAEGRWLTGNDATFPGVYSTFRVVINTAMSPAFKQGATLNFKLRHWVKLGYATLEEIDCMLERYIPAHCAVNLASLPELKDHRCLLVSSIRATRTTRRRRARTATVDRCRSAALVQRSAQHRSARSGPERHPRTDPALRRPLGHPRRGG